MPRCREDLLRIFLGFPGRSAPLQIPMKPVTEMNVMSAPLAVIVFFLSISFISAADITLAPEVSICVLTCLYTAMLRQNCATIVTTDTMIQHHLRIEDLNINVPVPSK